MPMDPNQNDAHTTLPNLVADLNEEEALATTRLQIANGVDPFTIVEDCRKGLQIVGQRYETREYFLSGLIMAGEIFQEIMQLVGPMLTEQFKGNQLGNILLGTVAGDIHNIGKNILSMLLTSYGFTINDLGVDVPPETFLEKAKALHPDIIALSGLLTSSFEAMRETIALIRSQTDLQIAATPIVIGGGTIDAQVCEHVGADYWSNDAMVGVRLFKKILEEKQL